MNVRSQVPGMKYDSKHVRTAVCAYEMHTRCVEGTVWPCMTIPVLVQSRSHEQTGCILGDTQDLLRHNCDRAACLLPTLPPRTAGAVCFVCCVLHVRPGRVV